jgi:hypothetical protein
MIWWIAAGIVVLWLVSLGWFIYAHWRWGGEE